MTLAGLTNQLNTSKGIICHISPREDMPVDCYGRVADIAMASEARTNRMNSGGLHEHYYNDAIWHARRRLLEMFKIPFFEGISLRERKMFVQDRDRKADNLRDARIEWLKAQDRNVVMKAWDFIIGLYRRVAPFTAHVYDKHDTLPWNGVLMNLATIIEDSVYLNMPPDYAPDYFGIAREVARYVGFKRDRVKYTGYSGIQKTTKRSVRIAPMYWMLLEKTGDTWSAVSFAKVQQYGFLAQINQSDRYSDPGRPQPIKGAGETEFRIIVSTCGQRAAAEIGDRNNAHRTRKRIHRMLITHETPGNIPLTVDRVAIPFGGHRAVQILHHVIGVGGLALRYATEEGT